MCVCCKDGRRRQSIDIVSIKMNTKQIMKIVRQSIYRAVPNEQSHPYGPWLYHADCEDCGVSFRQTYCGMCLVRRIEQRIAHALNEQNKPHMNAVVK